MKWSNIKSTVTRKTSWPHKWKTSDLMCINRELQQFIWTHITSNIALSLWCTILVGQEKWRFRSNYWNLLSLLGSLYSPIEYSHFLYGYYVTKWCTLSLCDQVLTGGLKNPCELGFFILLNYCTLIIGNVFLINIVGFSPY